ncbi:MAG TPA: NTP transferase domain-containing protein [Ignavibacteriaceae bacterium]|nr:NTP transferase domain-containing protein [Ignavibacteriaceae bacterium]
MKNSENAEIYKKIEGYSSPINPQVNEISIILAAGHGKRIKSQKSKMLHKIWDVPTVERVYNACKNAIDGVNNIVVVGIKAKDVIDVIGKRESTIFAYQENQNGTGHAVQVALQKLDNNFKNGIVYILPGDMGLIDKESLISFRNEFIKTKSDMLVLTGQFEGNPKENLYGRIIRVKDFDEKGNSSGDDNGSVIEIMEYKDILALKDDVPYRINYKNKIYSYTKKELLENNEFNSGVYAFDFKKLTSLINSLSSDNAQKEIYITEMISLFNKNGFSVKATSPEKPHVVMGFNNKSVLKEMETIARSEVYEKLKDIIEINDPDDFFIHESVVEDILLMDKQGIPLDIYIGRGVHIGKGVKLNYNLILHKNTFVSGNVQFGQNVEIGRDVHLSTFTDQTFKIGNHVQILSGDIIKGNIIIGDRTRIESSVNMTGSDEYPLRIGLGVLIKGTSYVFGSVIEDGIYIEHSVIIRKKVERIEMEPGVIQPVKFYLPKPEGVESIKDL